MLQYLEKTTNPSTSSSYWQIELEGTKVLMRYGTIGGQEEKEEQQLETLQGAFECYKTTLLEKLDEGYADPKNKVERSNFMDEVFEAYLEEKLFDKALNWLSIYDNLWIGMHEHQLLQRWLELEEYTAAERYILEKIQGAKDLNLIIRQVHHLSWTNPMLCRFMIGNLPPKPRPTYPEDYYRNLALAQSKIGMFSAIETTLKEIPTNRIKLLYLIHLLHTKHENLVPQMMVLEQAVSLLGKIEEPIASQLNLSRLLVQAAEKLGASEAVESLKQLIAVLEEG